MTPKTQKAQNEGGILRQPNTQTGRLTTFSLKRMQGLKIETTEGTDKLTRELAPHRIAQNRTPSEGGGWNPQGKRWRLKQEAQ